MHRTTARALILGLAAVFMALVMTASVPAQGPDDALARGFQDPPASARPRV